LIHDILLIIVKKRVTFQLITWGVKKLGKVCALLVAARPSFVGIVKKWGAGVERTGCRIGWVVPRVELFSTAAIVARDLHLDSFKLRVAESEFWQLSSRYFQNRKDREATR